MAFPSISVSDTFSGTATTLTSPNWAATRQAGNGALAKDGSAHAKANVAGFCSNRWLPATFTETEAYVDLVTSPASGDEWVGIYMRQLTTGSNDSYEIALTRTGTSAWRVEIFDKKSGTFTSRVSDTTTTWAAGDKIGGRVRTVGATVVVDVYRYTGGSWNQTPLITWTDSQTNRITTAGEAELEIQNTTARVSNFAVGTIVASSTSNTSQDARVTGQNSSSLATDVRSTGQTVSSVAYDVRVNGPITVLSESDARVTGQASSSTTYDVRIVGTNATLTSQDVRVTAQAVSSLATDARITGTIARKGLITWTEIEVPAAASAAAYDARISGAALSNASYAARISGASGSSVSYDARVTALGAASALATDARIVGQNSSSSSSDGRIVGTATSFYAPEGRVTGQLSSSLSTDVRINGGITRKAQVTWAEISVPSQTSATNRDVRIVGTNTANTSRDVRITSQSTSATSQDVRITGANTGSKDTIYQWYGGAGKSGVIDSYTRQVIRTTTGQVYAFIVDDWGHQQGTPSKDFMLALKADGNPGQTATEVNAAGRPIVTTAGDTVTTPDVRYDKNTGLVHLIYQTWRNSDSRQQLLYAQFDTNTDTWTLKDEIIAASGLAFINHSWKRSFGAFALSIDSTGQPHVVYGMANGDVLYTKRTGTNTWAATTTVSTGELAPVHFQSVIAKNGLQHVVWVRDSTNATSTVIRYANRTGTTWITPETVNDVAALEVNNFDQTPSVVMRESDQAPIVQFVVDSTTDANKFMRYRRRTGVNTWTTLTNGAATHAPTAYAQYDDLYGFEGHKISPIHPAYQSSIDGGTTWSAENVFAPNANNQDGSASVRYDPINEVDPNTIDWLAWDEQNPDGDTNHFGIVYYIAVTPRRLTVNQPIDARITAQATTNVTTDVRITGATPSVSSQDVRETGQATTSLATDARITGLVTAGPRKGFVTWTEIEVPDSAPKLATDTVDVRIIGQNTTSLATDARVTGILNSVPLAVDVRVSGISGSTSSLAFRGASTSPAQTNVDVRVTAQLSSNRPQDVRLVGTATSALATDARIVGTTASNDTRDARVAGQTGSSDQRDVRVSTLSTSVTIQDVRLVAQNVSLLAQDVRSTGQLTISNAVDVRSIGQLPSNTSYDVRLTGQAVTSLAVDARVVGSSSSSYNVSVATLGSTNSNFAVDAKVFGVATAAFVATDIRVIGESPASISTNVRITGSAQPFTEVEVRIKGHKATSLVTDKRVIVAETTLRRSYSRNRLL